ncbi:unnamed protein product [Eruca vesicaria subsp. sativa]|uniref:Uncharacterized protein n=1 Tax=Eruca vesicaria subsp. sativa TaxID=29727 RepID=A0ABC8LYB8_ERUVS|nr:unnamed protein product [Eruca vesicaria subsp. sativa]
MKLLGWMRTINRSGSNPSKELKGAFCCLRAQVSSEVQDIRTNSFSFSRQSHDPNPPKIDEEIWFDEGGFSGFLAIGTLGRDPETPKFTASIVEDDVTVAKIVTEKLDKFLEEYPEDSISKQVERSKAESDACPAQGHDLVRSSTELTKRSSEVKKIESLLKSLFKRRKAVERKCNAVEKHGTRDLIKKIFEKLHVSPSKTRNTDDDDDDVDSMHKKKDIRKNVQIFQSKVHPVLCTPERDDNKIANRRSCCLKISGLNGGFLVPSSMSKVKWKRENWIKTDAECKSRCYTEYGSQDL